MALVEIRKIKEGNYLGVWEIDESVEALSSQLSLNNSELDFLSTIKLEQRKLQWLASRLLIRKIINPVDEILMQWDENGKPELINYDFRITITHCNKMVAVIVGDCDAGVDLEKKTDRITRIAHKFINETELKYVNSLSDIDKMIALWSSKETIFKRVGGGGIDFRKHLLINEFECRNSGTLKGVYSKYTPVEFTINYEWIDDYILTWTI